jgi:YbgC/YbaW family acyl-CoA thioester hydrolase
MLYRASFYVGMDAVDALGVVYFARYWDWYEQCFEGLVAQASGSSWRQILGEMGLPYVHCEIDYRQPVHLSEMVNVEMALAGVGGRSVRFRARFLNEQDAVVAVASSVHVPVRDGMTSSDIPTWLRAAAAEIPEPDLDAMEGRHAP